MQHSDLVAIKKIKGKGRGVVARQFIPKGTLIEKVPVIEIPNDMLVGGKKNPTRMRFLFEWGEDTSAIVLGYGSIYNHSYTPNARYRHAYQARTLSFFALCDIQEGEEITINYNFYPDCQDPMNFDVV